MARATVPDMTDIYDALARGFRYPPRDAGYDEDDLYPYDDAPRPAPLPLEPAQCESLRQAITTGVESSGCDNTLVEAQLWARRERVPWPWLREALEERGGFCDCEVLMNVLASPD